MENTNDNYDLNSFEKTINNLKEKYSSKESNTRVQQQSEGTMKLLLTLVSLKKDKEILERENKYLKEKISELQNDLHYHPPCDGGEDYKEGLKRFNELKEKMRC